MVAEREQLASSLGEAANHRANLQSELDNAKKENTSVSRQLTRTKYRLDKVEKKSENVREEKRRLESQLKGIDEVLKKAEEDLKKQEVTNATFSYSSPVDTPDLSEVPPEWMPRQSWEQRRRRSKQNGIDAPDEQHGEDPPRFHPA